MALVVANDLDGTVCASAVDDDVFEVRIALQQVGADGLLDELPLVVARRLDRDAQPWRAVRLGFWQP